MRQRSGILLLKHIFLFSQLLEPFVFQSLTRCDSVIRVVNHEFVNKVLDFGASVRNKLINTSALNDREVEFHMCRILLKIVK